MNCFTDVINHTPVCTALIMQCCSVSQPMDHDLNVGVNDIPSG